jgi:hypothetical protein
MQTPIWYERWLDRPAELLDHATPTRTADTPYGGGIRRRLGRALIHAGHALAAEPRSPRVVRNTR